MKLLNKSIGLYVLYAAVLLLIAIPVLYAAIQHRIVNEMDESLAEEKAIISSKLEKVSEADFLSWMQNIQPGVTISPLENESNVKDRFYTITSYDQISDETSPYRIMESVVRLHGKPYQLQIKSSLLDTVDLIESIVQIVALLILCIMAGLVLINRLLAKKLWKPFYKTIHKLNEFKMENNEGLHFEETGIVEFTDLKNAITALTSRNKEVYLSQKEFTENAAHEMQTPLAVFQGKLDLLMQTNPLNMEQSELISDLSDVNQRMKRLNKTLLLLTKIENNQFTEIAPVSLRQVLEKLIAQYSFKAAEKGISLQHDYRDDILLNGNNMLLEIMLGNFISNAIKHNIENGLVMIYVAGQQLTFINSSAGIPLTGEKIFDRFNKQTADSSSLGLGLHIAKKIADNYQYSIHYNFKDNSHFFTIDF